MMLANRFSGQNVGGWLLSEKLDGVRAFWDGEVLRTRSWAAIDAPRSLTAGLPVGVALDGELWAGRGTFEIVRVLAQTSRHWSPEWSGVRFMVFDAPTTAATALEERLEIARRHALRAGVGFVGQRVCTGGADALAAMRDTVTAGGEGVVLRRPRSPYVFGRASDWLKVKPAHVE